MTSVNFSFRLSHFSLRFLIVFLLLTYGCGRSGDSQVVDFNKTIPVARPGEQPIEQDSLRVAVAAMISPKETFGYYRQVLDYIGSNLGKNVRLIQRKTYDEVNVLFGKGKIDLAFVCSGPYATSKDKFGFELLATPQVQGSHFYHSYLIVNKESAFKRLEDLKGRVFAFTDPASNTGKLVPTYWLAQMGERPEPFFGKIIYTYSHDNSILAVARGLVDGATVDGLIWEYYHQKDPTFTSKTRIIRKSEPYGIPPLVASKNSPHKLKESMRRLLFSMHGDPEGQQILSELMIDRFIEPKEEWYDSIRQMKRRLVSLDKSKRTHAVTKP
jgi:phosphonate transport system substrate-binding protein